jgi:hypothetical protein
VGERIAMVVVFANSVVGGCARVVTVCLGKRDRNMA